MPLNSNNETQVLKQIIFGGEEIWFKVTVMKWQQYHTSHRYHAIHRDRQQYHFTNRQTGQYHASHRKITYANLRQTLQNHVSQR